MFAFQALKFLPAHVLFLEGELVGIGGPGGGGAPTGAVARSRELPRRY